MPPDPAAIARRLSKAQREQLASFDWDTGTANAWHAVRLAWFCRAGFASYAQDKGGWHLTPLGLLVRAELERMEAGDGG
jgi:hypothetical protein